MGASTIDRKFVSKVKLGNDKVFEGAAVNTFNLKNAGDILNTGGFQPADSRFCTGNSLDQSLVKGKIVLCDDLSDGLGPAYADALGMTNRTVLSASLTWEDGVRQVHIVYMGSLPEGDCSPSSHHTSLLQEVIDSSAGKDYLVRSYKWSFNGFAATLNDKEQKPLAGMEGVVSVFPSRTPQLHTTRSWNFMGFTEDIKRNQAVESDVIIGVIDTGIWPESESFSDECFGSPPKNGRVLVKVAQISLATKSAEMSARDIAGHGDHTASTAAGNKVKDVSFFGLAQGNARGGVPSARIAAYKVCHKDTGCREHDVLAAFDDAIADGVDIISISMGGPVVDDLFNDVFAIGSFHAMEKGILTSNSAGNNGFSPATTSSVAPWLLSVAASTIDRRIITKVLLGSRMTLIRGSSKHSEKRSHKRFWCSCSHFLLFTRGEWKNTRDIEVNSSLTWICKAAFQLDLTAPGVDILAAFSPVASPSTNDKDKRSVNYTILSGTSMSSPHVAGAAAYVKSMHMDWSPSAIKSALMTTAWPMNATKNPDGEFSYGAGHIDPLKATHPGLVYETFKEDYVKMLCSMGYNVRRQTTFEIEFHRTVTNVGLKNSTYKAETAKNSVLSIKVVPRVLSFESINEKKSFVVTVSGMLPAEVVASSQLVSSDGTHIVRSPIVVYNTILVDQNSIEFD
ncbi:unnamed protein product [Ilex paraguariensis]|uniref:Uncharacterized protein n=1 Tax=Ilex paraguariensis TaxID=185542 RepID=A0ABC8V3R4_9AQUA